MDNESNFRISNIETLSSRSLIEPTLLNFNYYVIGIFDTMNTESSDSEEIIQNSIEENLLQESVVLID